MARSIFFILLVARGLLTGTGVVLFLRVRLGVGIVRRSQLNPVCPFLPLITIPGCCCHWNFTSLFTLHSSFFVLYYYPLSHLIHSHLPPATLQLHNTGSSHGLYSSPFPLTFSVFLLSHITALLSSTQRVFYSAILTLCHSACSDPLTNHVGMEGTVSSLSRLSASQVERASFTPGGCSQPNVQATKLPLGSTSENALQALQRRLAEQDARISLLERELRKNRLAPTKPVDYEEGANENQSVPGARSESAQLFNSKSPQPRGMHSGLAKSDGDALSAQMRYQILQLKLHSIVQKSHSIGVVDSSPLSSPPEQRPDLLDDVSPASEKPVTPSQDYSLDDLRAFESHLEMQAASYMNTHSDGGQKETIKALLEGIVSPTDVAQDYYTESKRLLPVRNTSRFRSNSFLDNSFLPRCADHTATSKPKKC